jgi:hypothetical protein
MPQQKALQEQMERYITSAGLSDAFSITFKPLFGARAAYANGRIFMSCGSFGVALKLGDKACQDLFAEGAGKPLKYFEKGHVKRGYVVLGQEVLADTARLNRLVCTSASHVQKARDRFD